MDRGTRTLIVVAVAVVTATAASASVYRAIRRIPVREVEVAHTHVVVAARPIVLGSRITASDLKLVGWPSNSPLQGAFTRVDEVAGRGLIAAVAANEPITETKLAPRDAGAGLSPTIPAGMRAISVKVNEVIGVAGFVVPGTHVDVVATMRRTNDAISRVLVSNVQVLTAGTRYDQERAKDSKPIPSTVVTLVVSPEQAEKIALASSEGQLTLMLRNPLDLAETETAGTSLTHLVGEPVAPVPAHVTPTVAKHAGGPKPSAVPPAAPVEAPAYRVEAIRAGKRSEETLKW
jgi:pilus assembly protein CpaB